MSRGSVNGRGQGLHGDLTTTGAVCLSSLPNARQGARGVLRLGDKTTPCPLCGEIGVIVDSLPAMKWMGIATVLDGAGIHCGCPKGRNRVIAPLQSSVAAQTTRAAAQPASSAGTSPLQAPRQSAFSPSSQPVAPVFNRLEPQEPGFYVVPKSMTREALEATLFPVRDRAVMSKFQALNPDLGEIKAGSMVVLSDPNNTSCTYQEAQLMQAAQQVKATLDPITPQQADFLLRHGAEIASFTGHTSTWLGVSALVMENHVSRLRDTLQAMERLHQESYRQHGHLKSPQFFADRRHLISQLDAHLLNSTRLRGQTTLGDHPKLKTALGISSRSLVHHWELRPGRQDRYRVMPRMSVQPVVLRNICRPVATSGLVLAGCLRCWLFRKCVAAIRGRLARRLGLPREGSLAWPPLVVQRVGGQPRLPVVQSAWRLESRPVSEELSVLRP